ncbi:hypothetical protein [Parasulfitobacter algicola]|uniref:N-acetyltransferase domain-containing protein n=1 Tax=Parasulfitobacter algicola TaxID=2614809 RepID=A0ABX2IQC7_9RHOB|nr:hypothetical protein [Sulfitobacter algicola]NSX54560.1 hypothetical protein [Sulfitobacter algicola]
MVDLAIDGHILRQSKIEDCETLGPHLRKADIEELHLAEYPSSVEALIKSFKNSKKAITVLSQDGQAQMMFGVGWTRTPRVGLVWLLASDYIFECQKTFLRYSRPAVNWMLEDHDLILNCVHDENTVSLNWLRWLSFEAIQHYPDYGIGAPFTEMALFKDEVTKSMYLSKSWPQGRSFEDVFAPTRHV